MEEFEDEEDVQVGEEELEIDLDGRERRGTWRRSRKLTCTHMGSTRFNGKIATCYSVDL